MVESNVLDSNEWPSLGGPPIGRAGMNAKNKWIPAGEEEGEGQHDDGDGDWENLQPLSPPPTNQRPRSVSVVSNVAVVERSRPLLRHCASSPDLRHLHNLDGIGEEEDDDNDEDYDVINNDAETLSYAVLSGPGSVMSMASGFSFRDAILSPGGVGTISEDAAAAPSSPSAPKEGARTTPRTEPRKPRTRPQFVVKPIKRCSKSMVDLRSLAEAHNEDDDDDEGMGASDAMDFYHRKALGAKGRTNGLKIRPDELKRKQFTLQRKEMQRQAGR
jgi:hypothetical protein